MEPPSFRSGERFSPVNPGSKGPGLRFEKSFEQRRGSGRTHVDPVETIKKLYFNATKATVAKDLAKAVEILKTLPTEEERERAAVYMDGLSQMRSEWSEKK
jgi:hypothetical protein